MERRDDPRFPIELSGILTKLSGPETRVPVLIQDISEGGVQLETAEQLECGSFILVEIEDSTLIGEVKYCRLEAAGYATGVRVERVLMGESPLSRLIETMLTAAY